MSRGVSHLYLPHTVCQGESNKLKARCSAAVSSPHEVYCFAQRHMMAAKLNKKKEILNSSLSNLTSHPKNSFFMFVAPASSMKTVSIALMKEKKRENSVQNSFKLQVWIVQPKGNKEKSLASGDAGHSKAIKRNGCYSNRYVETKRTDAVIRKKVDRFC